MFSHVSTSLDKIVASRDASGAMISMVLNLSNGSFIEAKRFEYSGSTGGEFSVSGGISDNMMLVTFSSTDGSSYTTYLDFVNIDTWTTKSYSINRRLVFYGHSQLFDNEKIILFYEDKNSTNYFSLQTSYNHLDFVETFSV